VSEKLLVTVDEACELISHGKTKVYELAATGRLEKKYIGRVRYLITTASLQAYVDSLPTEPVDT